MKVLNVGCGLSPIHEQFAGWDETRLDIDPDVKPDIVSDILFLHTTKALKYKRFDAVYSSHNLEHLYAHQISMALYRFYWVLKPGGIVLIGVPNLQAIAIEISQGNLENILYESPAGPIAAIDCVYGYRKWVEAGNLHQAHKTGFTPQTLADKMKAAGFGKIDVKTNGIDMWASGVKE